MSGGGGGGGGTPGADLLTVTVVRNENGYGMKVSGDNPVYVQSVKEGGAAWRAGLRAGDRIVRVNGVPVPTHTHLQVVQMIRASPNAVLTVFQNHNSQRHNPPITAPVPVDQAKQRQVEFTKIHTITLMLENEQKHMEVLRSELTKIPEARKQAELESAEQRCLKLQHQIDIIKSTQPPNQELSSSTPQLSSQPQTPRLSANRSKHLTNLDKNPQQTNSTGFLSGLPRSLSNLTGQSLRNLRQVRQNMSNKSQAESPALDRQNSNDETTNKRTRHSHNNTVPMVPVTCLDNTIIPPPLPPRSTDRPQKPKRNPLSPPPSHIPINPLAKPPKFSPSGSMSQSPAHRSWHSPKDKSPNHPKGIVPQYSMDVAQSHLSKSVSSPQYREVTSPQNHRYRRSAHSLDADYGKEFGNGQPNSIAMQMSYPLVAHPQPPVQDARMNSAIPILHARSQSSPEHLDLGAAYSTDDRDGDGAWEQSPPPPGTPPPPYPHNTRPSPHPQRTIISMEEDDAPPAEDACSPGLFSNVRSVLERRARTAVLLNWLLGERRCADPVNFLLITDGYRSASGVPTNTLRRWAYEIQSTFVMPNAMLALSGVDENMAREIDDVLMKEFDKEEILRNAFRKARAKAKEELSQQLSEFQVKRQVGLGMLYGPEDSVLEKCDVDKAQESAVVERLLTARLASLAGGWEGDVWGCGAGSPAHAPLLAATAAGALALGVRAQAVTAAVGGGARAAFLQRDKHYKQRLKQIAKQTPQPFIVRGHHFALLAVTSVADCQHCAAVIWGLAPQAYVCTDCELRVHRSCARKVEETCCIDGDTHNNRISRLIEKIHPTTGNQEASEKKSRKTSANSSFLNMERSARRLEDEQPWESHAVLHPTAPLPERRDESDESLYESADGHSDPISASDDALPSLGRFPSVSKESVKLAVTDEEGEYTRHRRTHRKTLSLSNPIEMVKSLSEEWRKESEKNSDKKKSKESLWSEEDRDSIHGSNAKLNERKNTKIEDKTKKTAMEPPKSSAKKTGKPSSVSALNFFRKKKPKEIETVVETLQAPEEAISTTAVFLEAEKRHSCECEAKPVIEVDENKDDESYSDMENEAEDEEESEEQTPVQPSPRRRLSRQTSRGKSKVRGKSQSVRVNTLRKSQSGTLKRAKKKNTKAANASRSRNASTTETPVPKRKITEAKPEKQNYWPFSGSFKGEARREGSAEECAGEADAAPPDAPPERDDNKGDGIWRGLTSGGGGGGKPVNRAESCREPAAASRRGKQRNASDPNRLTANKNAECEPASGGVPSGSSSSSSLSSRSADGAAPEQHASQSDWSEEEEPLAEQWASSVPPSLVEALSARLRKRQELIHELITSESSHVRWLKVLQSVFLRPLEREHGQLLSPEELKGLFPNLPAVRERHNRLYADLKTLRRGESQVVQIRPLADAVLNTLGDESYATCLSRFCRGQRMALEALRERRRKNKELNQFLSAKEQLPLCGRLQLKDLLAVVWQRLTKYELLLKGVLSTILDEDAETEEDIARLRLALDTAKDVLHRVDTAIRTAENEHRLRSIQSKLEVRSGPGAGGAELETMRQLDLTKHTLVFEGDLNIKLEGNKIVKVLALYMSDFLVLLQREGDKFVLKQMQPQQTGQIAVLTPIIMWNLVIFRENSASKNTFFLINIGGKMMYELSTNTTNDYNSWTRHILAAPLARANYAPAPTAPAHAPHQRHDRDRDDSSGGGVSRNASDASRTSASSTQEEPPEPHATPERTSAERPSEPDRSSVERPSEPDRSSAERPSEPDRSSAEREATPEKPEHPDVDTKPRPQLTMNGRITTHELDPPPLAASVHVEPPTAAQFARRALSAEERLRRLDEGISKALKAKSLLVGELLGVPADSFNAVSELAVAESLGEVDVARELKASRLERAESVCTELPPGYSGGVHQLLLAAQAQANQLTEALTRALNVTDSDIVSARHFAPWRDTSGLCDTCTKRRTKDKTQPRRAEVPSEQTMADAQTAVDDLQKLSESVDESSEKSADLSKSCVESKGSLDVSVGMEKEISFDMLSELGRESIEEQEDKRMAESEQRLSSIILEEIGETSTDPLNGGASESLLATRLVPAACALQGTLARLLGTLPAAATERAWLRRELAAARDANDALQRRLAGQQVQPMSPPAEPSDPHAQEPANNVGG